MSTQLALLLVLVGASASAFLLPGRGARLVLGLTLAYALITTTVYNALYAPSLILWLCNLTALLAFFLLLRFKQWVFNLVFYFAWTGDVLVLLIGENSVSPPWAEHPWVWMGFWLKHTTPLILTAWLILREQRRLSAGAMKTALGAFFAYTAAMFVYDFSFDANILDLRYPTLAIQKWFGPWPWYIVVSLVLTVVVYALLSRATRALSIVQR